MDSNIQRILGKELSIIGIGRAIKEWGNYLRTKIRYYLLARQITRVERKVRSSMANRPKSKGLGESESFDKLFKQHPPK